MQHDLPNDGSRPSAAAVAFALLRDGLERRIAGQLTMIIPIAVIAWIARDLPMTGVVWTMLGLQVLAQFLIGASSQWLRAGISPGRVPRGRHWFWMACEGLSGALWAVLLVEVAAVAESNYALHIWITVLITMAVSVILAAPIAGIAFPLLAGFAGALVAEYVFGTPMIDNSASVALVGMTAALTIIAAAVNTQARSGSRAQLEVASLSRRLEEQLGHTTWLSQHDVQTGLRNRRAASEAIARLGEVPSALVLVDIDHFKAINDRFGHGAGDGVLETVASLLAAHVTAAHPGAIVARWGGEEFLAILPGADLSEGTALAETLRSALKEARGETWPEGLEVTASFGVAAGPADRFDETFRIADAALYRGKDEGRDRVVALGALPAGSTPENPASRAA